MKTSTIEMLPEAVVYSLAGISVTACAGWITHIIVCIQDERYVLLVAGAIAAPIGAIHGIGCWFGWWG